MIGFYGGMNSTISITRLTKPSDTVKDQKSWTTGVVYSNKKAYIEPVDAQTNLLFGGESGAKIYRIIMREALNIYEGDKIMALDGRVFVAQGTRVFSGDSDIPDHTEINAVLRYPDN